MKDKQDKPKRSRKIDPAVKALRTYVRMMQGLPFSAHRANLNWLYETMPRPEPPTP